MFRRIVEPNRHIAVCTAFPYLPRIQQGPAHDAMPYHERNRRSLLLSECQELRCEITADVAIERVMVGDPEAIENREQNQWVFGSLSERFRSLNEERA